MPLKLKPLSCPDCGHTFTPELPAAPEIPDELRDFTPDPGVNAALMAKIAMVQAMLARLRDSIARTFGFTTTLEAANLVWTLRVEVPRPEVPADDAAIPMGPGGS